MGAVLEKVIAQVGQFHAGHDQEHPAGPTLGAGPQAGIQASDPETQAIGAAPQMAQPGRAAGGNPVPQPPRGLGMVQEVHGLPDREGQDQEGD